MLRRALLFAWIALLAAGAPARAEVAAAPFDGSLQRLAEILGALHYLRGLCGANEGAKWRNEMQALADAETPSGERRGKQGGRLQPGHPGVPQAYRPRHPAAGPRVQRHILERAKK